MEGMSLVIVHTIGAGAGVLMAGPLFDCKVPAVKAFAAAAISGALYLIPTVGFVVSFLALVLFVGLWGSGGWDDAFYTSVIAKGVVLIVALLWEFNVV